MKKILLLLIVSLLTATTIAQDTYFKWAKQFAGGVSGSYDTGWGIEVDSNGNVYTTGIFSGTVDFDPGPAVFNLSTSAASNADVYISKVDALGNFLWAKQIKSSLGTNARSLSLDKDFNIYVTGSFSETADFDPGASTFNLTTTGSADVFVLKLTKDGNFLWAKQMEGSLLAQSISYSGATDSFGNIYFAGSFQGTVDFDPGSATFPLVSTAGIAGDAFICKLDANGNFVWAGAMGGNQADKIMGVSIDVADNIYVTGSYRGIADFDPGVALSFLVSEGLDDIFILKLNTSGNLVWVKSIGGPGIDWGYKAVADAAGNVYATGFYTGIADFDPGGGIYNLSTLGADAAYVVKLDNSGNLVWAVSVGGLLNNNWGIDLDLDITGNIYTTGFFIGPADFDPGPGTFMLNSDVADMFILKLNNSGNFVWVKSLGSTQIDQGLSIVLDKYRNIYSTGHFGFTVDFDLETPTYYLTAADVSDPFVLKIAQCPATSYATISASSCQAYTLNGQTYTTSGTYQQVRYNAAGCDSIITLQLNIDTVAFTTVNAGICPGQSYYVAGAYQTAAGIYKDTLQTQFGCDSIVTTHLSLNTIPQNFLPQGQEFCYGNSFNISVPGYADYLWSTGARSANISLKTFGTFYLTVTDFNNCAGKDSITLIRKNCIPIGIPNAFTPNGDTKNDIFKPTIFQEVQNFSFIVFNRYGQTVFETRQYGKGWDGSWKGSKQPAGAYVYRIKFTNIFGYETIENGSVLLIR